MTEEKALRELQCGSQQALEWFIDKYTPYVTTVIYNVIGGDMTAADIEEVASDVFLVFWKNAQKVRLLSIKAYLGSVARITAKRKYREMGKPLPIDNDVLIISSDSPESDYLKKEREKLVKQAVLGMKQPDREIFLRHYYYGQSVTAISCAMQINVSTVKSKLSRGREKLRISLGAEE